MERTLKQWVAIYLLHEISQTWIDDATRKRHVDEMIRLFGHEALDNELDHQRTMLEQSLKLIIEGVE